MKNVLRKTIPEMVTHFKKHKKFDTEEVWQKKAEQYKLKKTKTATWRETCESFNETLCEDCNDAKERENEFFAKRLCESCSKDEQYTMICKSTAKKEFYLTDADLEDLQFIEKKNPHYRSGCPMILYSKVDVIDVFRNKYCISKEEDVDTTLARLADDRDKRSRKILDTKNTKKEQRQVALTEGLNDAGLELRSDSRLCQQYIDGTLDVSIPYIVEIMCEMKYLHEYCDMYKAYNQATEYYRKQGIHRFYRHDKDLENLAIDFALEQNPDCEGRYPDQWPWLD